MPSSGRPLVSTMILVGLLCVASWTVRAQDVPPPAIGVQPAIDPEGESTTPTVPSSSPLQKDDEDIGLGRASIMELVRQANPMLWPLAFCSVITLGYALERLVALRRSRIVPKDFVERFLDRLSSGKLDRERALELCRANESPVARIFGRIVYHWGQPANIIRDAVSAEAAGEVIDLKRNIRILNGAATLAPLLGLLGTVFGMIEAFDALGNRTAAGVGKSEALAHGISLALMATAFGLAIAIVAVATYYFLMNRVDVLLRTLDQEATRVIDLVAAEPAASRPTVEYRRGVVGAVDMARHEMRGM